MMWAQHIRQCSNRSAATVVKKRRDGENHPPQAARFRCTIMCATDSCVVCISDFDCSMDQNFTWGSPSGSFAQQRMAEYNGELRHASEAVFPSMNALHATSSTLTRVLAHVRQAAAAGGAAASEASGHQHPEGSSRISCTPPKPALSGEASRIRGTRGGGGRQRIWRPRSAR